ncbi:soma ferritin [Anopheles cruzii]|uniref:soma ferritin n=1 Tax=Anopheles cruzii TaxID=68878 RepID=UPI0022EC3B9F|nr:soma ferritin [Anopheles cruzii]
MANAKVAVLFGFVLVASALATDPSADDCEAAVERCSPTYSSFLPRGDKTVENDLRQYTSQLVDKSFHFLIMSSAFNKHSLDRPGFEKLYRKMSDKAWEDAVGLIKYQSRRGSFGNLVKPKKDSKYDKVLDVQELSSLQFALDYEKTLAKEAHAIHRKVSHAHSKVSANGSEDVYHYDPDAAHYLDEKVIEYQSGTVRDLAGYIHNLKHFTEKQQPASDLGNHLFDEYLAKAE